MFPVCTEGNNATSEVSIEGFEAKLGYSLPMTYRNFLLNCNGGRPDRGIFPILGMDKNPYGRVHFFYGVDASSLNYDIEEIYKWFKGGLPEGVIAIGCTEGSDYICLDQRNGSDRVAYWDNRPFWGTGIWREADLYQIADTFSEFLATLKAKL